MDAIKLMLPAGQGKGWQIIKRLLCMGVCVFVTFLHQPLHDIRL